MIRLRLWFIQVASMPTCCYCAEQLQISEHTVKVHLWRLFRRLNVKSRSQASHLARTAGLLDL